METTKNDKSRIIYKMKELSCFIGYDSKEDIAYRVCKHSLKKRSSIKANIYSLKLDELIAKKL